MLNSQNVKEDYEKASKINEDTKLIINFVKSKITQKKTDKEAFNNIFLNREIPIIFSDVNLNSERHYEVNKEELEII